ncbi:DUF11 domain-containing protein, partial [Arthrobacter rhizosphaerae]|uniref:DUF11 domain-containing protein n=1 Tax=Arthrobacter rhizosphaerae TaxID=2855490 RepID=UPI001FF18784
MLAQTPSDSGSSRDVGRQPGRRRAAPRGRHREPRHTKARRGTAASLIFALLLGLLGVVAPTFVAPPAQAAPGDAFNSAAATVFIVQGAPTRLYAAATSGTGTTTFTPVGSAANFQYNAVAYNTANNFLYANALTAGTDSNGALVPVGALIRIGQDGFITRVGTSTFGPGVLGTFGPNGNFYLANAGSASMLVINVTTGTLVSTIPLVRAIDPLGGDGADWTFKDGFFWALGTNLLNGKIVRINPTTGNIQTWTLPSAPCVGGGAGAAWTYGNGNLGFSCNSTGNVVQISVANSVTLNPTFTIVGINDGPPNTNNDGTASPGIPTDLAITKTGPATFLPGGALSYTLTVTNNGAGVSTGFVVADTVPAPLTTVATTNAGCNVSGNTVNCVSGTLAVGASQTFNITAQAPASMTACITNTANVLANEADSNAANNSASATGCPSSVPLITCSADPDLFNTGFNAATGGVKADGTKDTVWQVSGPHWNDTWANAQVNPWMGTSLPPADATWQAANVNNLAPGGWATSPYNNAQWISQQTQASPNQPGSPTFAGSWYYRYDFNLAAEVDPTKFALAMNFLADNSVAQVYVNGVAQSAQTTGLPQNGSSNPYTFPGFVLSTASQTTLTNNWVTGSNSIVVQVKSGPMLEGFMAQMRPSVLCPTVSVTKTVGSRFESADQFTVSASDSAAAVLTSATTAGTDTTATSPAVQIGLGKTYTLTDAMAAGTDIGNYTKNASCTGTTTGTSPPLTGTGPQWTFTPTVADDYVCSITNAAKPAALSLTKSASPSNAASYTAGQVINYSFVVANTGQVAMNNITVNETAFSGTGSMSAITCPSSTLAVGVSQTCTATYTLTQADVDAGTLVNTATANGTPPGSTTPIPSDPSTVTIPSTPAPSVSLDKSADKTTLVTGETVTYSFSSTNSGNVTLTNVGITDPLPGLSAVAYVWPGTAGTLLPGQTVTATATYVVTQADVDAGTIANTATISGTPPTGTPITGNDTVTITGTRTPGQSITKTADASAVTNPAVAGQVITYSFTSQNTGNVTLTNVAIADQLAGLSALVYTWPGTAGTLLPGQTVTATATYAITQADIDAGHVANSALPTAEVPPGVPGITPPPPATTDTDIPPTPGISLDKSADKTALVAGETVTYSFSSTNSGNVTLTNVGITDPLPGLSAVAYVWPGTAGTLLPGQTVTATATYVVTQADVDAGTIANTATISGTPPTGTPITGNDTVTITGTRTPGQSITKTADASAVTNP